MLAKLIFFLVGAVVGIFTGFFIFRKNPTQAKAIADTTEEIAKKL